MDLHWLLYGLLFVALNNLVLYLWKPWALVFAGEKGRQLVRREDLDLVLAEIRTVTTTQKAIETAMYQRLPEPGSRASCLCVMIVKQYRPRPVFIRLR